MQSCFRRARIAEKDAEVPSALKDERIVGREQRSEAMGLRARFHAKRTPSGIARASRAGLFSGIILLFSVSRLGPRDVSERVVDISRRYERVIAKAGMPALFNFPKAAIFDSAVR